MTVADSKLLVASIEKDIANNIDVEANKAWLKVLNKEIGKAISKGFSEGLKKAFA